MSRPELPKRGRSWYRALGRLHRYTDVMRHIRGDSTEQEEANSSEITERSSPSLSSQPSTIGPTDPDVYHARPSTPNPGPIYDLPRLNTPMQLLEELLCDIDDEERSTTRSAHTNSTSEPPPAYNNIVYDNIDPPPPLPMRPPQAQLVKPTPRVACYPRVTEQHERPQSTESVTETAYLQMASNAATRGSTLTRTSPSVSINTHSLSPPMSPIPEVSTPRLRRRMDEPEQGYEGCDEPARYNHPMGERVLPIPQGSPPIQPPVTFPTPVYYRDYTNPDVFPAYRLICHSVWYVQVSPDVIICAKCATSDHIFCASNRPLAVWRHLHVISREFHHTTMHCGRCYKLIMKTRRAVDCYQCRLQVIENQRNIDRLVYKVLCEIVVPRTLT